MISFGIANLAELYTASLAARSHPVHALLSLLLHDIRSTLNQSSKTFCFCMLGQVLPVRVVDDIVDVTLRDTMRDVLLKQLSIVSAVPFGTSTVQHKLNAALGRIADVLEAVILELRALGSVFAMHVAESGC